jgi:peroxiredoxin family protein
MGLLNIARDELVEAVDRSMGLTAFLKETSEDQLLYI